MGAVSTFHAVGAFLGSKESRNGLSASSVVLSRHVFVKT